MADSDMNLLTIRQLVAEFVREREWEQFHTPKDLAAAISIEASELQALLLWKTPREVDEFVNGAEGIQGLCDELADVLIFSLCLANRLEIDVADAVTSKLTRNAQKYPVEKSRGSNAKYTRI
jgi:NTP pyrophosphatase (non-canonical NTP hydrolase)